MKSKKKYAFPIVMLVIFGRIAVTLENIFRSSNNSLCSSKDIWFVDFRTWMAWLRLLDCDGTGFFAI